MDKNLEHQAIIDELSKYVELSATLFGKEQRSVIKVEKRAPMYDGEGVVYMLSFFENDELANNRIAQYMVMMHKGDQAGFHYHGCRKEQELYVIVHGEGKYIERKGEGEGVEKIIRSFELKKGAITAISGDENYHSIINTSDEPLIVFVVTTYEK